MECSKLQFEILPKKELFMAFSQKIIKNPNITEFAKALAGSDDIFYFLDNLNKNELKYLLFDNIGMRPSIKYSSIADKITSKQKIDDNLLLVEFGMYPKNIKDISYINSAKNMINKNSEKTDNIKFEKFTSFLNDTCDIYIYRHNEKLEYILKYKSEWFGFAPIKWIVNEKYDIAMTQDIIAGLSLIELLEYMNIGFEKDVTLIPYLYKVNDKTPNVEINAESKKDNSSVIKEIEDIFDKYENNNKLKKEEKNTNYTYNHPHLINDLKTGIYLTDNKYQINPAIGRENEIRELEKNLMIPKKGIILIGNEGVGKTAIVEGLAYKIQKGEVCEMLKNKGILSVDVGSLLAGCSLRGDFEEKIQKLCENLINSKNIILFLDEMHTTIGAGRGSEQTLDMANMLKTYVSNNQIKVIGCTTKSEFEENFCRDKAFRRRFNAIEVKEPDNNTIKIILKSYLNELANTYGIELNLTANDINSLIDIIIYYSKRILKLTYERSNNPDAAINILFNCFAYLTIENKKTATYKDFINGIIDNKSLNLSQMEIDNSLPQFEIKESKDEYYAEREKIKIITKK